MSLALYAAVPFLLAVLLECLCPVMPADEASDRLRAERQERAARAALYPMREIVVAPRERP